MPNLCRFSIDMTCDEDLPPLDKQTLSGFQPTLVRDRAKLGRYFYKCNLLSNEVFFELAILKNRAFITYPYSRGGAQ